MATNCKEYTIRPEAVNKESFLALKNRTLSDLLEDFSVRLYPDEMIDISLVNWIDSWQQARAACDDQELSGLMTEFIEFLYDLLAGARKRVVQKLRSEISQLRED